MNVNLIPEEQKTVIETENSNFTVTVIAIILVGVSIAIALMLLSITALKKGRVSNYENQISRIKQDIYELRNIEKSILMIETGISGIEAVSANQLKWSKIIPWFEKLMPQNLKLNDFNYNEGVLTISGEANSVEALNKFLISLNNATNENNVKVFSKVDNKGYSKSGDSKINFTIQLVVEKGGFLWN